jgi:hypothetical protein
MRRVARGLGLLAVAAKAAAAAPAQLPSRCIRRVGHTHHVTHTTFRCVSCAARPVLSLAYGCAGQPALPNQSVQAATQMCYQTNQHRPWKVHQDTGLRPGTCHRCVGVALSWAPTICRHASMQLVVSATHLQGVAHCMLLSLSLADYTPTRTTGNTERLGMHTKTSNSGSSNAALHKLRRSCSKAAHAWQPSAHFILHNPTGFLQPDN